MRIKDYITKDLVFGAVGGSILATIITSIIDLGVINEAKRKFEETDKVLGESILALREGAKVIKDDEVVIEELKKKYKEVEELHQTEVNYIVELEKKIEEYEKKEKEEQEKQKKKEKVMEAIVNNKWDEVYRLTEGWYNHYPVQMGRYEVFRYLLQDGYITEEDEKEARDYFGSLWNYVGD